MTQTQRGNRRQWCCSSAGLHSFTLALIRDLGPAGSSTTDANLLCTAEKKEIVRTEKKSEQQNIANNVYRLRKDALETEIAYCRI